MFFFRNLWLFFLDFLETIVVSLAIFALVYLFLFQPHQVDGRSMEPNFHNGEYILTDKVSYRLHEPKRGDVVVFHSPQDERIDFIKRIIALPNEKVKLENGKVFIINQEHPEGFLLEEDYLEEGTATEGRRTIKDGEVFSTGDSGYVVMGDNRERSSDSREWGVIGNESMIGKVWLRYWPPEAVALIKPAFY